MQYTLYSHVTVCYFTSTLWVHTFKYETDEMIDSPRGAKSRVSYNQLKSDKWKLVEKSVLLKTPLKRREPK